jgi:hypothetical protein
MGLPTFLEFLGARLMFPVCSALALPVANLVGDSQPLLVIFDAAAVLT